MNIWLIVIFSDVGIYYGQRFSCCNLPRDEVILGLQDVGAWKFIFLLHSSRFIKVWSGQQRINWKGRDVERDEVHLLYGGRERVGGQ